jgi:phenylpropionate dioxygenase-like ring-hydroxylating dioxygenase large terminal subunit
MSDETSVFAGNRELQAYWYVVARSADVLPGPHGVRLLGADYVVWRDEDGTLTVAPDRCLHREAKLSLGTVVGGCLECPYHGWQFSTGGSCVRVPSSGPDAAVPPKATLQSLRVAERYGLIWLCPGEPRAEIPVIVEDSDDAYRRINTPVETWDVSATRMVDNFLDIAHFPWVHRGTFGDGVEQRVPRIDLEDLDSDFFGYRYDVTVKNPQQASATSRQEGDELKRSMSSGFNLPFTCRSTILYETGLQHVLLLVSTPIDDVTSYFTFVVWRNDDFAEPADEVVAFDRAIGEEDRVMLETLDGVLPLDQRETVSVQSDKPSVEWRRRFLALLEGQRD